jgi:DNA-binding NarL/FixJ family response regulator
MKENEIIKVAAVEDDARLRQVVVEVLTGARDCRCVGVFPNGETAVAQLPALKPDVVIQDINLPDISGVQCVARLAPQLPETQFIMLTVYQDTETIFQALAAGAHGYLVKPVMPDKLLEAIREIRSGGVPMSRTIARQVIEFFHRPKPPETVSSSVTASGLGPREQQVLEFLVAGLSYKEIADELNIKVSTVGTYVQRIYEKLHVRSRREIIASQKGHATRQPEA